MKITKFLLCLYRSQKLEFIAEKLLKYNQMIIVQEILPVFIYNKAKNKYQFKLLFKFKFE